MFERNADQVQKQFLARYAAFGVFVLMALGAGIAIGGAAGVGVGISIALLGSFVSDIIHIGQATDNLAHNGFTSPTRSVEPEVHRTRTQSNFRDTEVARRNEHSSQERGL
jgi:hypothetical protein